MRIPRKLKLAAVALSTAGALSGAAIVGGTASASASTIPGGHVQICAQGNYTAYIVFPDRGGLSSTLVPQGHCWWDYMGGNSWEPINVYGVWNTHPDQSFYIGTEWYDGAVSGIGIGAEGVTTSPWLETW
jgi:hypothetical protein